MECEKIKIDVEFEKKHRARIRIDSMAKDNLCGYINMKFSHDETITISIDIQNYFTFSGENHRTLISTQLWLFFNREQDSKMRKMIMKKQIKKNMMELKESLLRFEKTKKEAESKKVMNDIKVILEEIYARKKIWQILNDKEFRLRGL